MTVLASKRAREAAAGLIYWQDVEIRQQPFAQFERTLLDEIEARVRGLKSRHAEPAWNTAIDEALDAIASIRGRE